MRDGEYHRAQNKKLGGLEASARATLAVPVRVDAVKEAARGAARATTARPAMMRAVGSA